MLKHRSKLQSLLTESVVGHLPKELSRYVYYTVQKSLQWYTSHRRSTNRQCLDKYETLVGDKYKEPVDGKFEDATETLFERARRQLIDYVDLNA